MVKPSTVREIAMERLFEAFAGQGKLVPEMRALWEQGSRTLSPVALYAQLVDARVHKGDINPARGEVLKQYFAESFSPDTVTGYIPKHRMPLIEGLEETYLSMFPDRHLYRVEADIANLGNFNEAVKKSGGQKEDADAVIRIMSRILQEELAKTGQVTPIRQGGDELCLLVEATPGNEQAALEAAVTRAQERVAEFVKAAGLRDLKHKKAGSPPGVGFGAAVVQDVPMGQGEARERAETTKRAALEDGITHSKTTYQAMLGAPGQLQESVDLAKLRLATRRPADRTHASYADYARKIIKPQSVLAHDKDFKGQTPYEAMGSRLKRALRGAAQGELTATETRLLDGTLALAQKVDFVTGLPMFATMPNEIAPVFAANFGANAKLVHFDFNNVGGANKIRLALGDAFSRLFRDCVEYGLDVCELNQFLPYLTSQGGGKFALLVPESMPNRQIRVLGQHVEAALRDISHVKLAQMGFSAYELTGISEALKALNAEGKSQRAANQGHVQRHARSDPHRVTLGDIEHTDKRSEGSHAVTHTASIEIGKHSILAAMDKLEAAARYTQVDYVDARVLEKRPQEAAAISEQQQKRVPASAKEKVEGWRARHAATKRDAAPHGEAATQTAPKFRKAKQLPDGHIVGPKGYVALAEQQQEKTSKAPSR